MKFNFKDKYINYSGSTATDSNSFFYSPLTRGGDGTRANPYSLLNNTYSEQARTNQIISGGRSIFTFRSTYNIDRHLIGNGMGVTVLDLNRVATDYSSTGDNLYFKDLTIKSFSIAHNHNGTSSYRFTGCEVQSMPINTSANGTKQTYFTRCKIKSLSGSGTTINHQNNNAFIGISTTIGSIAGSLHTFEQCNLIVNQASLDSYKNNYYAFDNCSFRIGTETEYTPLTGTTAEELRNNFVERCTAAGLTVPNVTDYGITLPAGRWIFTKNQVFDGITWKGSEIYLFEILRFISFGYSTTRGTKIPITTDKNVPASFAPISSLVYTDGLTIATDSLSIDPEIDITQRHNLYIDSKIIWLGGKKKLTKLEVPNNMPYLYGVLIDSLPNLLNDAGQEVTLIEPGEMYMVRSSDENTASVTYSGSTYSSALSSRNNIFKGLSSATSFAIASGRAVVYKINDILNYQSVQMRIVNKIPSEIIGVGSSLKMGYWYFVEHDTDQSNTTDYVKVGGVKYYVGDSFLIDSSGMENGLTITGTVHLRRCWKQAFVFESETIDKDFWQNEQKPEWCDVLPEDPRCLMKNNHHLSIEMQRGEDGKYITSGHPEYYNKILGASGIQSPDDIFISGTYIQIRLPITTVNPM